jgi:hypothetical protein
VAVKRERSDFDRREGVDRRKFRDTNYNGPERRGYNERRHGQDRRETTKE